MKQKSKLPEKNKRIQSVYGQPQNDLPTTDPTQTSGDPTSGLPTTTTHLAGFRR
ncbi:hypothetical protein ACFGVR_15295 [Mucilaginibacter sp. AW1-3]